MRLISPLRTSLVLLGALVLAGCSGTGLSELSESSRAVRVSNTTLIEITAEGAGPLNAGTPYSTKAIEAALPGFSTKPIQMAVEDRTLWTTGVFKDGFQVLQVLKGTGGRIGAVHGVTHDLVGPNGERLGMTFTEVGTSLRDCRVGRNLWRDMAICEARGAPNVTLVYAVPEYDGPFDRLPPPEELKSAMIQRIIWTPPGR